MDFSDNKLTRMSKRRFLKIASAAGVSAASLRYGTQNGLVKAADGNEVPYVAYLENQGSHEDGTFERKSVYNSIPRDEYEIRYTAKDASLNVADIIQDHEWDTHLVAPSWGVEKQTPHGFRVRVEYRTLRNAKRQTRSPEPSLNEVKSELPNKIEGTVTDANGNKHSREVPVHVERVEQEQATCQDAKSYGPNGDTHPGGRRMRNPDQSAQNTGTFTAEFYSTTQSTTGLIGSGHVIGLTDEPVSDAEDIGECLNREETADVDWAFVDSSLSNGTYSNLVDSDNSQLAEYTAGVVTDSTLEAEVGTNTTYYTQGRTTCRTSGTLIGVGGIPDTEYVTSTHNVDNGDSGGPLFKIKDGDAYIPGTIVAKINSGSDCKSTTAQTVEDHAGGFMG